MESVWGQSYIKLLSRHVVIKLDVIRQILKQIKGSNLQFRIIKIKFSSSTYGIGKQTTLREALTLKHPYPISKQKMFMHTNVGIQNHGPHK